MQLRQRLTVVIVDDQIVALKGPLSAREEVARTSAFGADVAALAVCGDRKRHAAGGRIARGQEPAPAHFDFRRGRFAFDARQRPAASGKCKAERARACNPYRPTPTHHLTSSSG